MKIYQIIYGNYYPREVDSTYKTREDAEARLKYLLEVSLQNKSNSMWEIEEIEIWKKKSGKAQLRKEICFIHSYIMAHENSLLLRDRHR